MTKNWPSNAQIDMPHRWDRCDGRCTTSSLHRFTKNCTGSWGKMFINEIGDAARRDDTDTLVWTPNVLLTMFKKSKTRPRTPTDILDHEKA